MKRYLFCSAKLIESPVLLRSSSPQCFHVEASQNRSSVAQTQKYLSEGERSNILEQNNCSDSSTLKYYRVSASQKSILRSSNVKTFRAKKIEAKEPGLSLLRRRIIFRVLTVAVLFASLVGCDQVYRLLQKEGAEEKDLLGEVISFESNPKVLKVQTLLKLYGYNPGAADGKFGVNTRLAIEKFQTDNKFPVHRFVDKKTWQLLNVFSESNLVVDASVNISKVQLALHGAGFNPGKIDGKLGPQTKVALKEFQLAHSLVPDGRMGFKTLSQLLKYLNPR